MNEELNISQQAPKSIAQEGKIDYESIVRKNTTEHAAFGGRSPTEPRNIFRNVVALEDPTINSEYSSWQKVQEAARKIDPELLNKHIDKMTAAFQAAGNIVDEKEVKALQDSLMDTMAADYF